MTERAGAGATHGHARPKACESPRSAPSPVRHNIRRAKYEKVSTAATFLALTIQPLERKRVTGARKAASIGLSVAISPCRPGAMLSRILRDLAISSVLCLAERVL